MQDVIVKMTDWLITQGWSGVIVIGLIVLVVVLIRERKMYRTEIKEIRAELSSVHEKRIAEGRESLTTVAANTNALQSLTQLISLSSMARR